MAVQCKGGNLLLPVIQKLRSAAPLGSDETGWSVREILFQPQQCVK